ncbi:GtrA family protein [Candidatus Saccharibacteria bacterium]|nr:GtrA family protein [Candidatus Saccharibacteria bacterium]
MDKDFSKRPLIFLGVGVLNTLLDFLFFTLLTLTVFTENDSIALAGIISGTFALICAFLTHGFITWRGRSLKPSTILRFFLFTGFGMWVIRPVLLAIFIHLTPLYNFVYSISSAIGLPFSQGFIANTGAFGFMAVLVLLYNYAVYDKFVFTDSK